MGRIDGFCSPSEVVAAVCPGLLLLIVGATAVTAAQPTDLAAFHNSGQTFLTWSEDTVTSGEGYHVYRHSAAITAANFGQARRLTSTWGPLPEGSSIYLTERDREASSWDYPGQQNYVITDLGPELADTTGLFVYTPSESGSFFYAVTTVTNGTENTSDFGAFNSLQSPLEERIADPLPVLVWEAPSGTSRVYTQFMSFETYNPTFDRPTQGLQYAYNYWVGLPTAEMCGGTVPAVLPLYLQIEGFGSRYEVSEASTWGWCAVGIWGDDPRQSWYYGFSASHDYREDSVPTTGPVVNYTEERVLRSVYDTMRSPLYSVDPQRVYVYGHSMGGSGALAFGMRYPTVFAATYSSEPMTNFGTSGDGGGVDWREDTAPKWGSLADNLPIENRGRFAGPLAAYDDTGVWDWQNHQAQLVSRRSDETAYIGLAHGANDDVIEWPTQGLPAYEPEWWPEYDVPIGAPTEGAGSDIDDLWDSASQVYRRDFDNGAVLLNPDPDTTVTVGLDDELYLVVAEGGGEVPDSGVPAGSLDYVGISQVTLPPATAAILLDEEPACAGPPSPPEDLRGDPWQGGHTLAWEEGAGGPPHHYNIYRSSGGCPGDGITPVLFAEVGGAELRFVDIPSDYCISFSYTVTASDAGGVCESENSNCISLVDTTGCRQSGPRNPDGRAGQGEP